MIHGLEEAVVNDRSEVYNIMQQGAMRRQTAATLMNAQSRYTLKPVLSHRGALVFSDPNSS